MSQKENVTYRMPPIEVGEPIVFYADGDASGEGRPGQVTAKGENAICICYFEKDAVNIEPKDGVRHVGDPVLVRPEARQSGAWDYAPLGREVRWLKDRVAELLKMARLDLSKPHKD